MSPEAWQPERTVGEELARVLIEAQFPELAPVHTRPLGAGFDNTAFQVNDTWVFRFPRRALAVPLLEREARALAYLAPRLPLAVPRPAYLGRPSDAYRWPFLGYRYLPGRTACAAALDEAARARAAEPLGRALAALHGVPEEDARALGLPGDELGRLDPALRVPRAQAALVDLLRAGVVDAACHARLLHLLEELPPPPRTARPTLVHGDLYVRHLLVDAQGQPSGIIDWGDVHLGHVAVDLAVALTFLPPGARDPFARAYGPIDAETWARARLRAIYHSAAVARYAAAQADTHLLREASQALRWCAAG